MINTPRSVRNVSSISCDDGACGADRMYSFFWASTRTRVSLLSPFFVIRTTRSTLMSVSSELYLRLLTLPVSSDSLALDRAVCS